MSSGNGLRWRPAWLGYAILAMVLCVAVAPASDDTDELTELHDLLSKGAEGVDSLAEAALLGRLAKDTRTLGLTQTFLAGLGSAAQGLTQGLRLILAYEDANGTIDDEVLGDEIAEIKRQEIGIAGAWDAIDGLRVEIEDIELARLEPKTSVNWGNWRLDPHGAVEAIREMKTEYDASIGELESFRKRLDDIYNVADATVGALNTLSAELIKAASVPVWGTLLSVEGLKLSRLTGEISDLRRSAKNKRRKLDALLQLERPKAKNLEENLKWLDAAAAATRQAISRSNLGTDPGIELVVRFSSDAGKTWGPAEARSTGDGTCRRVEVDGASLWELSFIEEPSDAVENPFFLEMRASFGVQQVLAAGERIVPVEDDLKSNVTFRLGFGTQYKAQGSKGEIDLWLSNPSKGLLVGTLSCVAARVGGAVIDGRHQELIRLEARRFGAIDLTKAR